MRKKLISLFLVTILLVIHIPLVANAAETSGSCGANGDNLTWSVISRWSGSDGLYHYDLYISGEGKMADFGYSTQPWKEYSGTTAEPIYSISISNKATSIGKYAFSYFNRLTNIVIPNSVTSIGDDAFQSCANLEYITIPDSVTSIGTSAFSSTAYYNDNNNWKDGVLYIGNHLIDAKNSEINTDYQIKNGTKTIANSAFYGCTKLTSITIPDSVTNIGNLAFWGCSKLTSITIPVGVTNIGVSTFYGCSSLKSITVPVGVTRIDNNAFRDCKGLTSIIIIKETQIC